MENIKNISKSILKVRKSINNIKKNAMIGAGKYAYKGILDKDVKNIVGTAMAENGLSLLPIKVKPTIKIDRWEEGNRVKQSVFTEVETKYLLLHESGESIEISGYGHGVDSQDKGAGKATTYALKYAMLYLFLLPTGEIEDADNTHSKDLPVPQKPELNTNTEKWAKAIEALSNNRTTIDKIEKYYLLSDENKQKLIDSVEL